jgi:hypothetical protein
MKILGLLHLRTLYDTEVVAVEYIGKQQER